VTFFDRITALNILSATVTVYRFDQINETVVRAALAVFLIIHQYVMTALNFVTGVFLLRNKRQRMAS